MNKLPAIKKNELTEIKKLKDAGFTMLAEYKTAMIIRNECIKLKIPVYNQTYRITSIDGEINGVIEPINEWVGDIPMGVVDAIILSGLSSDNLFVLTIREQIDPILMLKIYSGRKWYQGGRGSGWQQTDNKFYMELARWE